MPKLLAFIAFYFIASLSMAQPNEMKISAGYSVSFETSYAEGEFTSLEGKILFDIESLEHSKIEVTIAVSSISTGNSLKDKHAKKEKWFGAEIYPNIKFNSTKFLNTDSGYEVVGILALHGIKKEITIPFTFSNDTFNGSFSLNRLDYEVGTDTGFSSIVGTDIKLNISVPVSSK